MSMRKTLLLVFIHGFKGGDDTFGTFPERLRALVSHVLPNIDILAVRYPKFETRGELKECVARFREWLQDKVIDIEVARSTPSPTIDPSVHTILIGHSMGGIIAAETLLLLASEQPIPVTASFATNLETPNFPSNTTLNSTTSTSRPNPSSNKQAQREGNDHESIEPSFMFPHIQGLIAFDTPFLGLAPAMVAYGVEGGHKMATNAYSTASEVASIFGWGSKSDPNISSSSSVASKVPIGALPAPGTDAAAAPKWQSWGKYAMFAGAAGAVAAGGAAALYSQRDKISAGWGWAGSHLLFIGDLARAEHLRKRVETVEKICQERGLGLVNCYTNLGKGAREGYGITESVAGADRTFCNLPVRVREAKESGKSVKDPKEDGGQGSKQMRWIKAVNEKAKDETSAHMSMFFPQDNPGFYGLSEKAKELVISWVDSAWYKTSDPQPKKSPVNRSIKGSKVDGPKADSKKKPARANRSKVEEETDDWEGLDGTRDQHGKKATNSYDDDDDDDVHMRDEILDSDENDPDSKKMGGSIIIDRK